MIIIIYILVAVMLVACLIAIKMLIDDYEDLSIKVEKNIKTIELIWDVQKQLQEHKND